MDRSADVLLSDGATVHIRPIGPADADAIVALHSRFSERTRYLRYFSPYPQIPPRDLTRFVTVDHRDREALVAQLGGRLIAVGRYDRLGPGADDAEVAFVVEDGHQGRGIGSVLLEHLAAAAAEAGIGRFVAEVLPENSAMLRVFADAGYQARRQYADGVVHLDFAISPTRRSRRCRPSASTARRRGRSRGCWPRGRWPCTARAGPAKGSAPPCCATWSRAASPGRCTRCTRRRPLWKDCRRTGPPRTCPLLLARAPLPAGGRVAVVTNAAPLGALAVAACTRWGLTVVGRPHDVGPAAGAAEFEAALATALHDPGVDALVVACSPPLPGAPSPPDLAAVLDSVAGAADKPVVATLLAGAPPSSVPAYPWVEEAVRALGRVAGYARWRRSPVGSVPELSDVDEEAGESASSAEELLGAYAIQVVSSSTVDNESAAVAAAESYGYPVAVKAAPAPLRHRYDLGAVRLDLGGAEQVRAAYRDVAGRFGPQVLVQPMVAPGAHRPRCRTAPADHARRAARSPRLGRRHCCPGTGVRIRSTSTL